MSIKLKFTFRQLFWFTVGSLLLLVLLLGILINSQGQRIRHGKVDAAAVTRDRNQKIDLSLSQPVSSVSDAQVTITPAASFTVLAKGDLVTIQFKERLRYNTLYTIKLSHLRHMNGKENEQDLYYSFSTPPTSFYYLKRNYNFVNNDGFYKEKQKDEIHVNDMEGKDETVFSSRRIQEYCTLKDRLIIATITDDKQNRLHSLDLATLKHTELLLPESRKGNIVNLQCSPRKNIFGFSFTEKMSPDAKEGDYGHEPTLFISKDNPEDYQIISGVDNKPLQAREWKFAPDGTSILAESYKSGMLLVDSLGTHSTLPLGKFFGIGSFNFDGQSFITSDTSGLYLVNIPKYTKSLISTQLDETQPTSAYALQNADGRIARVASADSDELILHTGDRQRPIYRAEEPGTIVDYRVTPNDQYLIVTVGKGTDSDYDNYPSHPTSASTRIKVIDMDTPQEVVQVTGFDATWH